MPLARMDDDVEQTLKRKVQNDHTKLFEWVKYKCALLGADVLLDPVDSDDALPTTYRIPLDQIRNVQTKAGSRFEIIHHDHCGVKIREEFMAPTPQHCQRWVSVLQAKLLAPRSPVGRAAVRAVSPHEMPRQIEAKADVDLEKYDAMLSAIEATSPPLAKSWGSVRPASTKSIPDDTADVECKVPKAETPLLRRWTASENDAEEQLDILVRVESALKQLELDNKAAAARETELRQQVANLHDSVRLVTAEKQEALTQLREVAQERDEWMGIARQKQDEVTQLRDELQNARDEVRLLTNEQMRLHHRNRDLAVHVQRLDTLVYGKF
ncbi:hypothetical protein ACHHYP_10470 [Achlya hypogyna]|uniref:PH domain-containing protein n=1 Tax=Achlya hypogyna TaxID=1202772 RepID=A0A1V9YLD3_ACHHY|nr:hypothetical protein ACHHYP_10470 [Achlya hypogyna]